MQLMPSREGNGGEKINKTPTPAHRLSSPIWNIRDELTEASEGGRGLHRMFFMALEERKRPAVGSKTPNKNKYSSGSL